MNFRQILHLFFYRIAIAALILSVNLVLGLTVRAVDKSHLMDFDGDGKTDIGVYREGQRDVFPFPPSYFYVLGSRSGQLLSYQWGRAYDIHAPADYDGDGKTDVAIFRYLENDLTATASHYWIKYSSNGTHSATMFEGFGNIVSRNFFDDRKAEIAVFDKHDVSEDPINPCFIWAFYIKPEGTDFALRKDITNDCLPAGTYITPALDDFNGDGISDLAILFQSTAQPSSQNQFKLWFSPVAPQYTAPIFTMNFDIDYPIPGDYDGDGVGDIAGSKNVSGTRLWRIRKSTSGAIDEVYFGLQTDYPVPGDYDGDGKTDIAVFRKSSGTWYIRRSSDGVLYGQVFGLSTDIPLTLPNSNIYH